MKPLFQTWWDLVSDCPAGRYPSVHEEVRLIVREEVDARVFDNVDQVVQDPLHGMLKDLG